GKFVVDWIERVERCRILFQPGNASCALCGLRVGNSKLPDSGQRKRGSRTGPKKRPSRKHHSVLLGAADAVPVPGNARREIVSSSLVRFLTAFQAATGDPSTASHDFDGP